MFIIKSLRAESGSRIQPSQPTVAVPSCSPAEDRSAPGCIPAPAVTVQNDSLPGPPRPPAAAARGPY
eukprot:746030-Hanusia_phi.AAC.4